MEEQGVNHLQMHYLVNPLLSNMSSLHQPKLEDFLGGAVSGQFTQTQQDISPLSFYGQEQRSNHMSLPLMQFSPYQVSTPMHQAQENPVSSSHSSVTNLSALKSWLRQQQQQAGEQQTLDSACLAPTGELNASPRNDLTSVVNLQSLTLTMSPGTGQKPQADAEIYGECNREHQEQQQQQSPTESHKRRGGKTKEPSLRKSIDTFGQRTSIYRGVTS